MGKVTAYVLDESVAGAADGVTIPGVPGVWTHDRPVKPSALEFTVTEFDDAIETLGLPLKKVMVAERSAHDTFPETPGRLASAQEGPRGVDVDIENTPPDITQPDPDVLDHALDVAEQVEQERAEEAGA